MKVRLMQTGMHVPWQEGEILTVQVTSDEGDGMYTCESLETYPANLKELHAAELASQREFLTGHIEAHAQTIGELQERLAKYETPA